MSEKVEFKKPPKQWRQWCRKAGLKLHGRIRRYDSAWYYLEGHGRYWRLNASRELEVSDKKINFDRWANSVMHKVPCPFVNEKVFVATVKELLAEARRIDP